MKYKTVFIFGGTGFIGSHFCRHLLQEKLADKIYLADNKPLSAEQSGNGTLKEALSDGRVKFIQVDVRKEIPDFAEGDVELIANFAAVHREPGHQPHEYFETNIYGAENVCAWANKVGCKNLIFTSSISPYGPSEEERNELSLPVPATPYGASKLVAEKIHLGWKALGEGRKLLIVRPGVVFGPGEGGNVTRLVRAVIKRYFLYMGNKETRKAGGYVKELCNSLIWGMGTLESQGKDFLLYNFTMDPPPSVGEYVKTICEVAEIKRKIPHVPFFLLNAMAYPIEGVAKILNINQPVSPVRIKKLVRSNYIMPGIFRELGYKYKFTLSEAMRDWKSEKIQDWK